MDFAQYNEIQIFFKPRFFQSKIEWFNGSEMIRFQRMSGRGVEFQGSVGPLWSCQGSQGSSASRAMVVAPRGFRFATLAKQILTSDLSDWIWCICGEVYKSNELMSVPCQDKTVCGCPLNKELPCGFQVIYGFPDPGMICNLAQMWWNHNFELFFCFFMSSFHAFRYQTSQRETSPTVQAWCRCNWCDLRHVWQVPTLCQALDTIFLHCKCQWLQRFSPIPSMQPSSFPCEILGLAATQHWTICHGGMWCGRVEKGGKRWKKGLVIFFLRGEFYDLFVFVFPLLVLLLFPLFAPSAFVL